MEEFQLNNFGINHTTFYYNYRQKIFGNLSKKVHHGMTLFAIMNAFWSMGIILEFLITGKISLNPILFNFDIGFIMLLIYYFLGITNSYLVPFIIIGWIVASFYAKLRYGPNANISIFYGIITLPLISFIVFMFIILPLTMTGLGIITLFYFLVIIAGVFSIWFGILAIPGIVIANVLIKNKEADTEIALIPNFLVLISPPIEKKEKCPFKNIEPNGCSFLGYRATDNSPLICDFKSTYTSCSVYKYLYERVEFEGAKNK